MTSLSENIFENSLLTEKSDDFYTLFGFKNESDNSLSDIISTTSSSTDLNNSPLNVPIYWNPENNNNNNNLNYNPGSESFLVKKETTNYNSNKRKKDIISVQQERIEELKSLNEHIPTFKSVEEETEWKKKKEE